MLSLAPRLHLSSAGSRLPPATAARRRCLVTKAAGPSDSRPWDFGRFIETVTFFNPPQEVVRSLLRGLTGGGFDQQQQQQRQAPSLERQPPMLPLFVPAGGGVVQDWGSLDDVVMGGRSASGFAIRQGAGEDGGAAGVFSGLVTSANNGGFASVRCRNLSPPLDLSAYKGLELRLRGDGQRYKYVIRSDSGWDAVGYTASFDTQQGWQTIRLPFSGFVPVFRARTMRGGPPLDLKTVYSFQLMLSKFEYDGALNPAFREGEFELPLQRISAYMAEAA